MSSTLLERALELSPAERLRLAEALWDSLASNPDQVAIPQWHKELLDERLKELDQDGSDGSSWPEVKARIHKRP